MGDRGNIVVKQNEGQVWFYTHWSGYSVKAVARDALARKLRWTDDSYLARIVGDELMPKDNHGGETGFGISTSIGDNSYPIVVIDVPKQRVFLIEEEELKDGRVPEDYQPSAATSFEKFSALTDKQLEKLEGAFK